MTIGERLRYIRKVKLGFKNCDDFGAKIGLSGSNIRNIENGRINITDRVISNLCNVFYINEDWLRNGGPDEEIFVEMTQDEELEKCTQMLLDSDGDLIADLIKNFIVVYQNLDSNSKQVLKNVANELLQPKKNETAQAEPVVSEPLHIEMRLINYYYRLASAGTGQLIFDMPPTKRIEIPNMPAYKRADYAIGVNGNSMFPVYKDGDTLLIEMTDEIEIGEIGIFLVDGESYVKKLGNGELISLNPEFKNITLTESSRCMGKVIGIWDVKIGRASCRERVSSPV